MQATKQKHYRRIRRHARVRATLRGLPGRPRLSIFRSLKHIRAQIIDDTKGRTMVSASDLDMKNAKGSKSEIAAAVGKLIGERAKAKKISAVVFDRGAHQYHGRVKVLADAARAAGLTF